MGNLRIAVLVLGMTGVGAAMAQSMLLDEAASKMVTRFQASSCEDLKAAKEAPKTPEEEQKKMVLDFLKNDAQARAAFVNKVAAPTLNKMFDCGMLP